MPVIAMKCVSKSAHEKTESLFIYIFESPKLGSKTIVANLTNVYEEGDVAAIAQLGTWLPEGEMKPRKVFGIDSEGMALGPVDAEPDADLTERFDADASERSFVVTMKVEVTSRYPEQAEKVARKQMKSQGVMISAELA
mgnify:CR=1 FL=1